MAEEMMSIPVRDWAARNKKLEEYAHKGGAAIGRAGSWSILQFGKHESAIKTVVGGALIFYALTNKAWTDKIPGLKDLPWYGRPLIALGIATWMYVKKNTYAQVGFAIAAAFLVKCWRDNKLATDERTKAAYAQLQVAAKDTGYETGDADGTEGTEGFQPDGGTPDAFANRIFDRQAGRA